MTDKQPDTDPKAGGADGDDQEVKFWDKLSGLIDERLEAGIENAVKKYTQPSSSRNGGRGPSIPQFLARAMGGPFTPVE
jgi:hypothetical protein